MYWEDGQTPRGPSELSTTYPQNIQFGFDQCVAALTMSQSVNFPAAGTYQLSYYLAPDVGRYSTDFTCTPSVGSSVGSAVSVDPNVEAWTNETFNFTVAASGNQTLAFLFQTTVPYPNNIHIAAVTITYVSA